MSHPQSDCRIGRSRPSNRAATSGRLDDAALGAFAYLVDAVTGAVGGPRRWQTMPWVVLVFALFVGPLGAVSVFLTIAQPVLYGHWCTLCLASAAISMLMIGPAMDEALASLQYMRRVKDAPPGSHAGFWKVFWGIGSRSEGGNRKSEDGGRRRNVRLGM